MSDMRHNQAQTKKEEEYAIKSMASIEKAARKAYEKDVAQAVEVRPLQRVRESGEESVRKGRGTGGGGAPPTESERKRRGKRFAKD
jgi:hypothetical protein